MPFDGTTLPTQAAYLIRAKNYLLERGWCSCGPRSGPGGRVCMMMALSEDNSLPQEEAYFHAAATLAHVLRLRDSDPNTVGKWNDQSGRTLDEVLGAFDAAIALEMR